MATAAPSASAVYPDLDGLDLIPPPSPRPEDADRLVAWVRKRAYSSSPLYAEDFSRFRKSELYDQTNQWIQRAKGTSDATYASQWKRLEAVDRDGNVIPLPVYNEGVLQRENESARLGRPEYKPRVHTSAENPGIKEKEGAKGAERALQSRLTDMWADEEDKLYLHMPLYGGAWLKSAWDQTWLETVRVPAEAVACALNPKAQQQQAQPQQPQPQPQPQPQQPPLGPGAHSSPAPAPPVAGQSPLAPSPASPAPAPPVEASTLQPPVEAGAAPGFQGAGMAVPPPGMGAQAQPGMQSQLQPQLPPPPPPTCDFVSRKDALAGVTTCPYHPDQPLVPYQPTLQEAAQSDLGDDVPKGDWYLKVVSPYGVFPTDAGINIDPTNIPEWVEQYTMPISWAEERWPDKVRDPDTGLLRVHPANPASLMAANPTLGAPDILRHVETSGVYRNHVVVFEYHRKPWLEWQPTQQTGGRQRSPGRYVKNQGRTIFIITGQSGNGVVCFDGPHLIESLNKPGEFVERVLLQYIPWEKFDGSRRATIGQSMWDRMFDPQDGINERASQTRSVNQRGADPFYIEKRGSNLESMAASSAVPMRRIQADIDPNDKQPPIQLLNNEVINPGVYQEIAFNQDYLRKNQVEVEAGQVPPGVAAATAIAYLKTEAGEKRRPRILRIRRSLVRGWRHGLQLMSALYIEPRPYSYDDENGEERQAFITGDVIAQANPKVDIYPTPDYDITDARRESIRDMVQLGILKPDATPQLSRKIVEAMDETLSFFLDDDNQEQQAQREWQYFKDQGRVPVTDPSLDDDQTHYQCHGRDCFSEWFRQKEDEAQWDQVLKVIGGDWDTIIDAVIEILMMPAPTPPAGVNPGTLPKPAPKPAADDLLKVAWLQKISQVMPRASQNEALMKVVIPWRAHMEAHRVKARVKQMRDSMPQPMPGQPPPPGQPGQPQPAPGGGSQPGPEAGGAPGQGSQPGPEAAAAPGATPAPAAAVVRSPSA